MNSNLTWWNHWLCRSALSWIKPFTLPVVSERVVFTSNVFATVCTHFGSSVKRKHPLSWLMAQEWGVGESSTGEQGASLATRDALPSICNLWISRGRQVLQAELNRGRQAETWGIYNLKTFFCHQLSAVSTVVLHMRRQWMMCFIARWTCLGKSRSG